MESKEDYVVIVVLCLYGVAIIARFVVQSTSSSLCDDYCIGIVTKAFTLRHQLLLGCEIVMLNNA